MRRFWCIVATCWLVAVPQAFAGVYDAQEATLDNGMQVVVIPVHRTPAVTHMVWYKNGAADEPYGQSGVAHFLEHLMFKGSLLVKPGEFSRIIKKYGGNDNAFTSWDYTAYFQTVPVAKLEAVMRMEADRMANLNPPLEQVTSERAVVIEERRQTVENDPVSLMDEQLRADLFVNHPYGRPILGWAGEMAQLEWTREKAYYDSWYAPNNAILVISGDTTLEQVLPMAKAIYGSIKRKDVPARMRPAVPDHTVAKHVVLESAAVQQAGFTRMMRVPSYGQNKQESLALTVLDDVLSGATGRLYREIVVTRKLASNIGAGYSPRAIDDGTFTISADPVEGVTLEQLEKAVDETLAAIAANGIGEDEIRTAIGRMQDSADYTRDSLSGPAMEVGYGLVTGVPLADLETWPELLNGVDAKQVQAVLKKYVIDAPGRRVTGYLLPAPAPAPASAPAVETPAKAAPKAGAR